MISIENEIITKLATPLRTTYQGIYIASEKLAVPPSFPCVFIEEADNYSEIINCSNAEALTGVMYEINVFSNKRSGKKTECKKIMGTIDDIMISLGFNRNMCQSTPNADEEIYRMTARYSASVTNNKTIFRR